MTVLHYLPFSCCTVHIFVYVLQLSFIAPNILATKSIIIEVCRDTSQVWWATCQANGATANHNVAQFERYIQLYVQLFYIHANKVFGEIETKVQIRKKENPVSNYV